MNKLFQALPHLWIRMLILVLFISSPFTGFLFFSSSRREPVGVQLKLVTILKRPEIRWPKSVLLSPDGSEAFIHNLEGKNTLILDTENFSVKKVIQHKGKPVASVFTDQGRYVWISLLALIEEEYPPYTLEWTKEKGWDTSYRFPSVVEVYDRREDRVIREIPVGIRPKVLEVSPDGKYVLVSNWTSNSVTVIDAKNFRPLKEISTGKRPRGICFPSHRKAYVLNMGGNSISVLDMKTLEVSKLLQGTVGGGPRHCVLSADRSEGYISANGANKIQILKTNKDQIRGEIAVGSLPRTIVLHPNGRFLFVTHYGSDTIGIVDLKRRKLLLEAAVGKKPVGAAVSSDGKRLWVTNYAEHSVHVFDIRIR